MIGPRPSLVPKEAQEQSPMIQRARAESELEMTPKVAAFLKIADPQNATYEMLEFPKSKKIDHKGHQFGRSEKLAIALFIVERRKKRQTTTKDDLGKFIGMSTIADSTDTIITDRRHKINWID